MIPMVPVACLGNRRIDITFSSNRQNVNLYLEAGSPLDPVDVYAHLSPGILIGSASVLAYAFETDNQWTVGSRLIFTVEGLIMGRGGRGGKGGDAGAEVFLAGFDGKGNPTCGGRAWFANQGENGEQGGLTLRAQYPIKIILRTGGVISAPGGGGAGGGGGSGIKGQLYAAGGGAGGGGQGFEGGLNHSGGNVAYRNLASGICPDAALLFAGGAVSGNGAWNDRGVFGDGGYTGQGFGNADMHGGRGGYGGYLASWGENGQGAYQPSNNGVVGLQANGGQGGAPGSAVHGNAFIEWVLDGGQIIGSVS